MLLCNRGMFDQVVQETVTVYGPHCPIEREVHNPRSSESFREKIRKIERFFTLT
jgi:hypothetical protein